jgi:hypothetical protein
MKPMRRLLFSTLLMCCTFLCGCAGTTYTNFTPSSKANGHQRNSMREIVDSTATFCGMSPIHNPGEEIHGYQKGDLSLDYDLGWSDEITGIYLQVEAREKSVEFNRVEQILTLKLRRVDPHIKIESGWMGNPMM